MGPRSDERGNLVIPARPFGGPTPLQWGHARMSVETDRQDAGAVALGFALQWGHARMSVETGVIPGTNEIADWLQWGHARMSVETSRLMYTVLDPPNASMGPRSDERGNPPSAASACRR